MEVLTNLGHLELDEMGAFALTPAAIGALEEHPWPGNVRELRAVVRTAARLAIREAGGVGPCQLQQEHVEMALAKISLTPTL